MSNDKFLISQPVCYDPSVDPNNMDQYAPKDYRVTPLYQKIDNKTETGDAPLPKYAEAISDIQSSDPSPPYEQLLVDDSGITEAAGNNNNNNSKRDGDDLRAERKRKNKKFAKFALHFTAFLFILFVIQANFSPFGCGSSDGDASDAGAGMENPDTTMMSYKDMDDMMGGTDGAAEGMMNGQ